MRCAALGMAWWHFHVVELWKKSSKICCHYDLGGFNLFIILPLQNGRRKKCGWPQLGREAIDPGNHVLHMETPQQFRFSVGVKTDTTGELVFQLPESLLSNSGRCDWAWKEDRKPYKLSSKVIPDANKLKIPLWVNQIKLTVSCQKPSRKSDRDIISFWLVWIAWLWWSQMLVKW